MFVDKSIFGGESKVGNVSHRWSSNLVLHHAKMHYIIAKTTMHCTSHIYAAFEEDICRKGTCMWYTWPGRSLYASKKYVTFFVLQKIFRQSATCLMTVNFSYQKSVASTPSNHAPITLPYGLYTHCDIFRWNKIVAVAKTSPIFHYRMSSAFERAPTWHM